MNEDRKEYYRIHTWIRRRFGPATCCENLDCLGRSKRFQYALIKGKNYERQRDNFMMLCISCHLKYDWDETKRKSMRVMTEQRRQSIGMGNKGKKRTQEQLLAMSERNIGEKNPFYGKGIKGEGNPMWRKHHSDEVKKKIFDKQRKLTDDQIKEIRTLASSGTEQKEISNRLKVSRATICRIVNNKRYKHGLHV